MPLTVGERSLLCTTSECIYYASQDNTHSRLCWTWPKWPTLGPSSGERRAVSSCVRPSSGISPVPRGRDGQRSQDSAQDDRVSSGTQFVKWQNVEPRAFVAGRVQQHSHRVLFQQGWQPFVDGQIFVGFQMQQLVNNSISFYVKSARDYEITETTLPYRTRLPITFLFSVSFCFFSISTACCDNY